MEPISRLNKLLEILRQRQTATKSSKLVSSKKAESTQHADLTKASSAQSSDLGKLKSVLRSRLKSLSNEDIASDKAHTIFLEAILTWEFGMDLLNDQEFHPMIDSIKDSMTQDATLKKMIDSALLELVDS